jgi:hypothetical protein
LEENGGGVVRRGRRRRGRTKARWVSQEWEGEARCLCCMKVNAAAVLDGMDFRKRGR